MRVDSLTINEWLQTDQQFLNEIRIALHNYRQGQSARKANDEQQRQMQAG